MNNIKEINFRELERRILNRINNGIRILSPVIGLAGGNYFLHGRDVDGEFYSTLNQDDFSNLRNIKLNTPEENA